MDKIVRDNADEQCFDLFSDYSLDGYSNIRLAFIQIFNRSGNSYLVVDMTICVMELWYQKNMKMVEFRHKFTPSSTHS